MKKRLFTVIPLILMSIVSLSQEINKTLSVEQYKVVNDLFGKTNTNVGLKINTSSSKTWLVLINYNSLKNLLGPPCIDGEQIIEWESIFEKKDLEKIKSKILHSESIYMEQKKLSKNIILFTNENHNNNEVDFISEISTPILINNYCIIKKSSSNGETILIAEKKDNLWMLICQKWVFKRTID